MGDQPRRRHSARDRQPRHRCLHHRLARPARHRRADVADHLEPPRNIVQDLGHRLAHHPQPVIAAHRADALDLVADLAARKGRRKIPPGTGTDLPAARRRAGALAPIPAEAVIPGVRIGGIRLQLFQYQFQLFDPLRQPFRRPPEHPPPQPRQLNLQRLDLKCLGPQSRLRPRQVPRRERPKLRPARRSSARRAAISADGVEGAVDMPPLYPANPAQAIDSLWKTTKVKPLAGRGLRPLGRRLNGGWISSHRFGTPCPSRRAPVHPLQQHPQLRRASDAPSRRPPPTARRSGPSQAACNSARNAGGSIDTEQLVRITHPFHPFSGHQLVCVGERYNRSGKRLLLRIDDRTLCSVPPQWTDLIAEDPEVVMSHGRALLRVVDLLELANLVAHLSRERRFGASVKRKDKYAAL